MQNKNTTENAPEIHQVTGKSFEAAPSGLLDFDSDEPLAACPLRNNGNEVCESCQ